MALESQSRQFIQLLSDGTSTKRFIVRYQVTWFSFNRYSCGSKIQYQYTTTHHFQIFILLNENLRNLSIFVDDLSYDFGIVCMGHKSGTVLLPGLPGENIERKMKTNLQFITLLFLGYGRFHFLNTSHWFFFNHVKSYYNLTTRDTEN